MLVFVLTFGGAYFTALNTVEDDCGVSSPPATTGCEPGSDTKEVKALYTALAAGFAALVSRFGFEGVRDAVRQSNGTVNPGDVQLNT